MLLKTKSKGSCVLAWKPGGIMHGNKILLTGISLFLVFCQGCFSLSMQSCFHDKMRYYEKDVTCEEPYSEVVGVKYVLKVNCYLVNKPTPSFRKKSEQQQNASYPFIVPCERYIGEDASKKGVIAQLLPKGTEFIIYKIVISNCNLFYISVHIPSLNIDAMADDLVILGVGLEFDDKFVSRAPLILEPPPVSSNLNADSQSLTTDSPGNTK